MDTHLELLALLSRLGQLRGGAAFRRLLLRHQVHVQNCAFTLLEAFTKNKKTKSKLDTDEGERERERERDYPGVAHKFI